MKQTLIPLFRWLRGPVTWACQHGYLSPKIKNVLPWRWATEPFTIYVSGYHCRWLPTIFDDIARVIFWSGIHSWEKETSPIILEHVRRSRCFIDVGANCGIYTILAAITNPSLHVVAIEPVPKVCAALVGNIEQNQLGTRVTVLNVAAGNANGIVDFHEADNPTMASLDVRGYNGQAGRVIKAECRTLDSIVAELNIMPDFVKIDVEGFSDVVLDGATELLEKFHPRIVLEANLGDNGARMTEILRAHGYTYHLITDNGPKLRSAIVGVDRYRNWLCLPPSHVRTGAMQEPIEGH